MVGTMTPEAPIKPAQAKHPNELWGVQKKDPKWSMITKSDGSVVLELQDRPKKTRGLKTVLRRQHRRAKTKMPFKLWCAKNGHTWK